VIHATLTGYGACNGTYTLTWDPNFPGWHTSVPVGTCPAGSSPWDAAHAPALFINCTNVSGPVWNIFVQDNFATSISATGTCSPLNIVFNGVDLSACGCGGVGTVTITL
jgi:hypothetical protein